MTFEGITGHEGICARLLGEIRAGRVAPAYLFTGPRGVGKAAVARCFAAAALCTSGAPPCGTCASCTRAQRNINEDLLLVSLPEDRREIPLEEVRDAIFALHHTPVRGFRRVLVVDDAHALGAAAQNTLLKTLEEPPGRAMIVLITAQQVRLLPTVRSRCRRVRFAPLPLEAVRDHLVRVHGLDAAEASRLAALSGGSIGEAEQWMANRDDLAAIERALDSGSPERVISLLRGGGDEGRPRMRDRAAMIVRVLSVRLAERREQLLADEEGTAILEAVAEAPALLAANVNPQTVIANLVLRLPSRA
jgi:DNA polymerase-3 subunit delta'